jgi:hypothetical protein
MSLVLGAWLGCMPQAPDMATSPACYDLLATTDGVPALWTELRPSGSPPGRLYAASAFDADSDRLIVFGGVSSGTYFGDVWVLSGATDIGGGATWVGLPTTGTAPAARSGASAAYDAAHNRLIVLGGANHSQNFADVWVLANANGLGGPATWSALTTTGEGPRQFGASSVYDAASNTLIVFGGAYGPDVSSDAWALSNANGLGGAPTWSKAQAGSPPPARELAAAVLDSTAGTMILFGGDNGGTARLQDRTLFDDIWTLSPVASTSRAFAPVAVKAPPTPRTGHSLAFDAATGRAILFAGATESILTDDVHILSTTGTRSWAIYATGKAPPPRFAHVAAYSPKTNRLVVFGGETYDSVKLTDTWVLDHANGTPAAPIVRINVLPAKPQVCATKKQPLVAVGTDAAGNAANVPVVWTCSDPAVISSDGEIVGTAAENVTCTACLPDGSVCSDPTPVEITPAPKESAGGSGPGGSSGSSGSSGGSCPGGFMASERSCIDNGGTCTCNDFPCSACIQSADFPSANGSALSEGQSGCIDTDGSATGSVGTVIRPCAPGLCCLVGGACGGGGSRCGQCLSKCQ